MSSAIGHLPSLSKDVKLTPSNQTQHSRVLSALHQIAAVSVTGSVKEGGHRYYVVELSVKPGSQRFCPKGTHRLLPSVQTGTRHVVKRRLSQLVNLRDELFYHAHAGHIQHAKPCEFCGSVIDFLNHASSLPKLHKMIFNSQETTCEQLEDFLNLVVQLAKTSRTRVDNWCEGYEMVPLKVKQFLLGDDGEEDASVPVSQRGSQRRPDAPNLGRNFVFSC